MSMERWAEEECRIACKRENPEYDFDGDGFDYGCSCYKSALKAYKSLIGDEHSGTSWEFTRRILERLMEGEPLTAITDEDFFDSDGNPVCIIRNKESLMKEGLLSEIQCPRKYSLFRKETVNGVVSYHDIDRCYFIDIEEPSLTYQGNSDFLDRMFPIEMPYLPKKGKYKIYTQSFLVDKKNGDFDTEGILYIETPEGERVEAGIYHTEKEGKTVEITREEYEELLKRRIDKLSDKIA